MNVPQPKKPPKLTSLSATAIKTFRACPRAHSLEKRFLLPKPQSPDQALGEAVHKYAEEYFSKGKAIDPDSAPPELLIPLLSLKHLLKDEDAPQRRDGQLVEHPGNLRLGLTAAGVPMFGKIDLVEPPVNGVATVTDWKTTKSFDWNATGEQLKTDPQCTIYAKWAFENLKPDAVVFQHGYINKVEVGSDLVATDPLTKEFVDEQYAQIEETAREAVEHFKISNFFETRPGKGAPSSSWGSPCRSYGGCAFAQVCGVDLTRKPKETAVPDEKPLSLKERLAKAKLATGINPSDAAPPAPVTPYVPTATAAPTQGATTSTVADLAALLFELDVLVARIKQAANLSQ